MLRLGAVLRARVPLAARRSASGTAGGSGPMSDREIAERLKGKLPPMSEEELAARLGTAGKGKLPPSAAARLSEPFEQPGKSMARKLVQGGNGGRERLLMFVMAGFCLAMSLKMARMAGEAKDNDSIARSKLREADERVRVADAALRDVRAAADEARGRRGARDLVARLDAVLAAAEEDGGLRAVAAQVAPPEGAAAATPSKPSKPSMMI